MNSPSNAKYIEDAHETYSNDSKAAKHMNYYNNAIGKQIGKRSESCESTCMTLIEKEY